MHRTPDDPPVPGSHRSSHDADPAVDAAAAKAIELVTDGACVGLGTGRASLAFISKLGERVRQGLRVSGVPTSGAAAQRAREAGVPLVALDGRRLDLTVDGADEVSPALDLVKGWGGALVRERIVAAASARQVIIVGEEKLVRQLGERGRVPIEVRPGALDSVGAGIEALGLVPTVRMDAHGEVFITENGNPIIDAAPRAVLGDASAVRELERRLLALRGVVDTGLFLGTAERVLVGYRDGHVETLVRSPGN